MKFYACLVQNDPLVNGIPCYRIIECHEFSSPQEFSASDIQQRFQRMYLEKVGLSIMFFHLPTKDVKDLL